jgi:gluconolactonase
MRLCKTILLSYVFVVSAFIVSCGPGFLSTPADVVAPGAEIEMIATGFGFTEGPVADILGNLYFTDEKGDTVHKLTATGAIMTVINNTGQGTGLYIDNDGILLLCEQDKAFHRLVSVDFSGGNAELSIIFDEYKGKSLNAPNDVWVHPDGGIYFTDPNWTDSDEPSRVFYISSDRKTLVPVIDDLDVPNGVVGSLDGKTLYVTDGRINHTYAYDIKRGGKLSGKTLFAEEGEDGMTVDTLGNVYITSGGISVYNSAGDKIQTIEVPESTSNACFGGKDMRTLYITAQTSLYAVKMNVRGF